MVNKKYIKKSIQSAAAKPPALSLTRINYLLFALAAFLLIIGYVFMSIGPVNSFWSLTLSPIVLVFSYCVVFPLAILWRPKSKQ
jgi:hypothetical protein